MSLLVIGIGNLSRGDDALGPLLVERLQALNLPNVECLSDYQLQVEYALDLIGCEEVLFIDASVNAPAPFSYCQVAPEEDASYSSHALSPAAVLHACRKLFAEPPPANVLAIRGASFELGDALSPQAAANLEAAWSFLQQRFSHDA